MVKSIFRKNLGLKMGSLGPAKTRSKNDPEKRPEEKSEIKLEDSSRQKLLEVATRLFAEQGFSATSTREIAQEAELNISLISYYFEGKEGLYKAVIEDFAHNMRAESERMLAHLDLENLSKEQFSFWMRQLISGMLTMKYSQKDLSLLLHREVIAGLPYAKDVFEQVFSKIAHNLVSVVSKAQEKGIVRPDINPYILFFSLAHSVDQYILMSNRCQTSLQKNLCQLPDEMDQYSEQIYKIFIEGVIR